MHINFTRKEKKKNICIIVLLISILVLSNCSSSKMNSEIVPLEDGLYFQYETITDGQYEIVEEQKFTKQEDGNWLLQKKDIKMREKGEKWLVVKRE